MKLEARSHRARWPMIGHLTRAWRSCRCSDGSQESSIHACMQASFYSREHSSGVFAVSSDTTDKYGAAGRREPPHCRTASGRCCGCLLRPVWPTASLIHRLLAPADGRSARGLFSKPTRDPPVGIFSSTAPGPSEHHWQENVQRSKTVVAAVAAAGVDAAAAPPVSILVASGYVCRRSCT